MKTYLFIVVVFGLVGIYSLSRRQVVAQARSPAVIKAESPFYCNRTAITADQRLRQKELGKNLHAALLGVQELPDGYEFEFPPDRANYDALTEFTPLEHACCPFFDVSIRLEREHGKLWWRLTGRDGVKPFIRAEFSPWFGGGSI
jgi:hypothetical protein